jgi:hypothetical protein
MTSGAGNLPDSKEHHMDRKTEFQRLYARLGMSAVGFATLIGGSPYMVRQYVSIGKGGRIPPEGVINTMRAAWHEKAQINFKVALEHLHAIGNGIDRASLDERMQDLAGGAFQKLACLEVLPERQVRNSNTHIEEKLEELAAAGWQGDLSVLEPFTESDIFGTGTAS